jgi:hypothetical protein
MFIRYPRRGAAALAALVLALLIAAACGGGRSPSASPTTKPGEKQSSVSGVVTFVAEKGLDGRRYELTDPLNCEAIVEPAEVEDAQGKVCVSFASGQFSSDKGAIEVRVFGTEESWELTLELRPDLSWLVTGAKHTGE